ncbi:LuxR C-terminal-related transcriptional regulator [Rhizobium sp. C4]|uniref:LuxR C-terminal-related transcriptional regulator n=1 Tax=Rhizobium sp. C4 TaxID=1349800 RepID=UPI001E5E7141|nr:LuxR C-terminal-related transcriptional regulator [Rhizobium sp. C4]MCD2175840.1 LuxR C-terminal-related transcriptional regulator [Rhizobium sp. C4]
MTIPARMVGESVSLVETLTRSELRCLALTGAGHGVESIARKLALATQEVETLLFCAERKLGAQNRMHAVCVADSMKVIDCND